ncbi:MAG TPA: hydroxymethylbilane synthase [Myxococcales bacterium]|nr:hydroxymethylbilane synthase [Myxococcales bacterium]
MTLRIATRKSALALWQSERVAALLYERGHHCELLPMSTEGDRVLDRALNQVGGKGLFVKELEHAMAQGRADLAVHSAKDVPYVLPKGFSLSAIPQREDPRDALIAPRARFFSLLPKGARVGTSSLRRAVQLQAARPDLVIVPVRGNVQTRLGKAFHDGGLDAVVLAFAGLRRLGLEDHVTEVLPIDLSLPAAGQGALAIEAMEGSAGFKASAFLDDPSLSRCVKAERAVLERLGGGCTVPIAAHAVEDGARIWLRAALGGPENGGVTVVRAEARGFDPAALGSAVAEELLDKGGAPLLEAAHRQATGLPPPRLVSAVGT